MRLRVCGEWGGGGWKVAVGLMGVGVGMGVEEGGVKGQRLGVGGGSKGRGDGSDLEGRGGV